jgi:hypothetical protein
LALEESTERLLDLRVLLPDTNVQSGKAFILKPVCFSEETDHFLGGFAARQATKAGHKRGLEVREPLARFGSQFRQITV